MPTENATLPSLIPNDVDHAPRALAALHEVLGHLSRGDEISLSLDVIAQKAVLLTGAATIAIALLEKDHETISFAAAQGAGSEDLRGSRVHWSDTVAGHTARTGEPYLAFREAPGTASSGEAIHSAAVVAVFDEGKPAGALAALNKNGGGPFSGEDLMALSTLAAAVGLTLGNGRLRLDSRRRQRELTSLYESVRRVSGQILTQDVLRAAVEQVTSHLATSAVAILLLNDERSHLYIAESEGLNAEEREITLLGDTGVGARLLASSPFQTIVFVADEMSEQSLPYRRTDGVLVCEPLFPPRPGLSVRSGIAAPIRAADTVHGILIALSGQSVGVYSQADANLLSALASQAAVAIENAYLFEDATHRAEEATALYELSQAINSTLSLPEVLDRVAESVLSLLSVDKFALFLHERRAQRLRLVVSRGLEPGAEERLAPEIGQGIPGWVLEFETPTAVRDVAADHRNASAPLHEEGVVSMTAMPLQVGASTIGVLCALTSRRRLFTVGEMELLYTIANQAAIAIENARVYASVRHKTRELRRYFYRVTRALGSSRAPDEVSTLIVDLTREVMAADRCALWTVSPEGVRNLAASVGFRTPPEGGDANDGSPTALVVRRARPLAVGSLSDDERFSGSAGKTTRSRAASYLGVPLRSGTPVTGVLEVYTREPREWSADEVRLLLTFASQASVALDTAAQAQQAERTERERHLLLRLLTDRAAATADLTSLAQELSPLVGKPISILSRADRAEPWQTPETESFVCESPSGLWAVAVHFPLSEAPLQELLKGVAACLDREPLHQ